MKHYFLKDKVGNRLGFKVLESQVYDNNGKQTLLEKLAKCISGIEFDNKNYYTVDLNGNKTKVGTLPGIVYENATDTKDGLMSYRDKMKLDGVANNANKITFTIDDKMFGGEHLDTEITSVSNSGKKVINMNSPVGFRISVVNEDANNTYLVTITSTGHDNIPSVVYSGESYNTNLLLNEVMNVYSRWEKFEITIKNVATGVTAKATLDASKTSNRSWYIYKISNDVINQLN